MYLDGSDHCEESVAAQIIASTIESLKANDFRYRRNLDAIGFLTLFISHEMVCLKYRADGGDLT